MNWITTLLGNLNYGTIFFLMLLESTVVPVPSELVVAPAAYHAAGGHLNAILVVIFATLGADVGASINYFVALYVGRPVIYRFANSKWGKMCLLNQEKVEKSERYFDNHGVVATLTGRLIPGIRHLISLPAGLARMNYWKFLLYTTIGAGVCMPLFPRKNSKQPSSVITITSYWLLSPSWCWLSPISSSERKQRNNNNLFSLWLVSTIISSLWQAA